MNKKNSEIKRSKEPVNSHTIESILYHSNELKERLSQVSGKLSLAVKNEIIASLDMPKSVIKLDLDGEDQFNEFLNRLWCLKNLGLDILKVSVFSTRHGYHAYLFTDNHISKERLITIEAILNDDWKRVLGSLLRLMQKAENTDPLFSQKHHINKIGEFTVVSKEEPNLDKTIELENQLIDSQEQFNPMFFYQSEKAIKLSDKTEKLQEFILGGKLRGFDDE